MKSASIDFSNPIPIYQTLFNTNSSEIPFELSSQKRTQVLDKLKCERIEFIPHVHSTHLETKAHLGTFEYEELPLNLNEPLFTVIIQAEETELMNLPNTDKIQFIIIKKKNPKMKNFEGISAEFVDKILKMCPNLLVLGINEPSFDPENDGGAMLSHKKVFYNNMKCNIYLIELLNLDQVNDTSGEFYCFLNLFRMGKTDAYPCSPVLYRIPANQTQMVLCDSCLFCKIIRGAIPSFKVYETKLTYAFLDINPLSEGHILVIPKFHGARLHEITDEHLADILPATRKILLEGFGENGGNIIPAYNILQNNGRIAHQEVDHVHFHIIPKRNDEEGLGIKWPARSGNMTQLAQYAESIRSKISQ